MHGAGIRRRAVWGGVLAATTGLSLLASVGTANAASSFYTANVELNVRSGPSTSYSIVQVLAAHTLVHLQCQTPGQSVTGTYGTTTIWDKLDNNGYVSDAYVNTGSDGYVVAHCPS
jgi:uncharacterized protein YraI